MFNFSMVSQDDLLVACDKYTQLDEILKSVEPTAAVCMLLTAIDYTAARFGGSGCDLVKEVLSIMEGVNADMPLV